MYPPRTLSGMRYKLQMREIVSRPNIDEKQTVKMIIDGLQDNSNSITILYSAQTINDLNDLSHRYVELSNKTLRPPAR